MNWSPFRNFSFRLVAAYACLFIFYTFLRFQTIPGLTQLHRFIWPAWRSVAIFFNDHLFHVRETLVDPNSSTDTSLAWALQWTTLIISVAVAVVWTIVDRKRPNYEVEEYWLRTITRYFVAYFCLYYGIIKLFALQMPFPSLSQLSTTLGDLSPARLAWMFLGASPAYQIFSGIIETAAGLFLMYRRTTTLGAVLAIAVFGNVVALNFSYDIPVKLMSAHILLFGVYLLSFDYRRIVDFFFLNRPAAPNTSYRVNYNTKWSRYTRIIAKLAFLYVAIAGTIMICIRVYRSSNLVINTGPIEQGIYNVEYCSVKNDSLRWRDMVLYGVTGSIETADTIFVQRYNRGYFSFEVDSVNQQFKMKRSYEDKNYIATLNYEIPDKETVELKGLLREDSLFVILKRSKKKFRLSEPNQFHWLQESPQ